MRKPSSFKNRSQSGNILILAGVFSAVIALGLVMAYSFGSLYFTHNRLQTSADEIALTGARKLNELNRLGQMNDMIVRSRQLVYSTRKQCDEAEASDEVLQKLARQLMEEARAGAGELETERKQLTALVVKESEEAMNDKFNQIKESYAMVLPWLKVETPRLVSATPGRTIGMHSNAQELAGFDELVKADQASNNVVTAKPVNLFKGEINAKLPSADGDLPFCLSPLAAPVDNDMAPARMVLPAKFQQSAGGYAPCATKVEIVLKVSTGLGTQVTGNVSVTSAASATGGGLWQ